MVGELWFYLTTVLICTGYAWLMQRYPQGKLYVSLALLVFIVGGAVLVYFDAKEKEDMQTKIEQTEHMLDVAKKEKEKQESLTRDATDKAHALTEQLRVKTEEMAKVLKDKPQIEGEIKSVRIFPWQRASGSRKRPDDTVTTTGILVFARVRNEGFSTKLTNWELTITLPDNTIVKPQKWPVHMNMKVPCEDGRMSISKDQSFDAKTKQALHKTGERSGATVWMMKGVSPGTLRTKDSVYTLTARDDTGRVHALEKYGLSSVPEKCFGFDVSKE
ncbi:MAG TPA: hypothetical protein VJ746_09985 [Nitrospira sp.]|nr:hypothetical protein [Nitrospira sp.]